MRRTAPPPSAGSNTNPRLVSRSLTTCRDTLSIGGRLSGVTLIDIGEPDAVAGRVLDFGGKRLDGSPVADIGRGDVQSEQVAGPTFRSGSQSAAVDDGSRWIGLAATRHAKHGAQILSERLEATRRQPSLRLLVDRPLRSYSTCSARRTLSCSAHGGRSFGVARQAMP